MNWLKFDATVEEAETLLQTEYRIYENVETGKSHLACDDYSIPHHLIPHVDFITPTIQFDAIVKTRMKHRDVDESVKPTHGGKGRRCSCCIAGNLLIGQLQPVYHT